MNVRSIYQTCDRFALIDVVSGEWLCEHATYRETVESVRAHVKPCQEYVIVAVLKQARGKGRP